MPVQAPAQPAAYQPAPMYQQAPPQQVQPQYQQPYPQQPYQQQAYQPQPYQQPGMQPPMQQPAKPKKTMMIVAVVAIVVVIALVLVVVLLMSGVSTATPEGALRSMSNAMNNYDAKGVVDSTIDKFASTSTYNAEVNTLNVAFVYLKTFNIKISVSDVTTKTSAQMTQADKDAAQAIIDALPAKGINVNVTDYAQVTFTMSVTGNIGGFGGTFPSGAQTVTMLQVNGGWYLGTGFNNMFT